MSSDLISLPAPLPAEIAQSVKRITLLGDQATIDFHPTAAQYLDARKRVAVPGTRKQCHEWMAILVLGINGVKEADAIGRETAIWAMCHPLPAFVWCQKTVNETWARTPFLPGPGEVFEVLEAHARPLLDEIAALEKIAAAPPLPTGKAAGPYVIPPVPDWCFDRKTRKRSRVGHLLEPDEIDDCPPPRGDGRLGSVSIARLIEPMIGRGKSLPDE